MRKSKKPMTALFTFISIAAVLFILFYISRYQQAEKLKETSKDKLTEVQRVLDMDLDNDYPKTPRDVAKLHGDMTRLLYSGIEDDEIDELAIKIRELYDDEFLENNPMEQYLKDLYTDIALWLKVNRRIENNFIVNEDQEEVIKKDGREYATAYVSFTITERGKTSELRRYLMQKDKDNKWKILGWEYIPENKR